MKYFNHLYLDKEKDIIVDLFLEYDEMHYEIRTPNHKTGNLITNLAKLCDLPISYNAEGLKVIRGLVPCYFHPTHREVYIFRLRDTKVANIYPNGTIEIKAMIPSIAKTLMSQTKDYRLSFSGTLVKTYILNECKFRTDLHTHLNANLKPDLLIALGIFHQIRYPLYYIKKLGLRLQPDQESALLENRQEIAKTFSDSPLQGKYLDRKIDDAVFINFADLILNNLSNAAYNIPLIRASLTILKDGQAVFTNLEKVYLYRYVFAKGVTHDTLIPLHDIDRIPDEDIVSCLTQMLCDGQHPIYRNNTLYQNKLLWTARSYQASGIHYVEISDTNLVKPGIAIDVLEQIHAVMPAIYEETHVRMRFLAAFRRIPLTIIKDQAAPNLAICENLRMLQAIMVDPYIAGCDIVGEEMNDIRQLSSEIRAMTEIAAEDDSFVIRIHAGENDGLKDNVANSIACVKKSLAPGQRMPRMRIGHGLYTADLRSRKGQNLLKEIREDQVVLEFQITSNVRLNNLSSLQVHPLKQYLEQGVPCVQGTDGGALYGTDSMDEQLALQNMLNLTPAQLKQMREAEETVITEGEAAFLRKMAALEGLSVRNVIEQRYEQSKDRFAFMNEVIRRATSEEVLSSRIAPLPPAMKPIVICGGSYNNDLHVTRMQPEECALIDSLLESADPEKNYFVIGNQLKGYERYLLEQNRGRFRIYAFVTSVLDKRQEELLKQQPDLLYRVSIEPEDMGLYKSVAYEIFKQRESILIAFDGNSAAANLIQEANNSKYECRIFIDARRTILKQKAENLSGYITLFHDASIAEEIKKYL